MSFGQAKAAWVEAKEQVKRLRTEQAGLQGKIEDSDLAGVDTLLTRQQNMPALIASAEVAERKAYAVYLDARVEVLQPELEERQQAVRKLHAQIDKLQAKLSRVAGEAQRLHALIRNLQSDRRRANVEAEDLQLAQRERLRLAQAPVVRALNV